MVREPVVRLDKWLWAVRIYKTRSQATEACRSGKVKMNDVPLKPSHEVKAEEVYNLIKDKQKLTFRVISSPVSRVGAPLVSQFVEDITPESDKIKPEYEMGFPVFEKRPRGLGRPTKQQRRKIDRLKKGWMDNSE